MNHYIRDYIDVVRGGEIAVCKEQLQLCDMVERVFEKEDVYLDEDQLERYLKNEKYFPFDLFAWEKFCFALHNCVYRADGQLRFPELVIMVGRGTGKNGFLSFENFNLLTPVNGVKEYHIDTFATSEDQAKASWTDVYNILESNEKFWKKYFYWTKEVIRNLKTGSEYHFRTSAPKTKDGGRPGKVDFDEYHAYENYELIDVVITGLGKKRYPRRTIITTNGKVRGGPYDDLMERCERILNGKDGDNGTLPFICRVESEEEIKDKSKWVKANPSLPYLPNLQYEMELEFTSYLQNPIANASFALKRMNLPPKRQEGEVTSWENIKATNQPIDYEALKGQVCIAGVDYAKTTDFASAGLLFDVGDKEIWITHTWVCRRSEDLSRVKAPLDKWEAMGLLTLVDDEEITATLIAFWLAQTAAELGATIIYTGIDSYRYQLMKKALKDFLYASTEKGYENVVLTRPSDEMMNIPVFTSEFIQHKYVWGDNPLMRWATNNAKQVTSPAGNITYGKIEPKSRKTDPFKAFVAAKIAKSKVGIDSLQLTSTDLGDMQCFTFD